MYWRMPSKHGRYCSGSFINGSSSSLLATPVPCDPRSNTNTKINKSSALIVSISQDFIRWHTTFQPHMIKREEVAEILALEKFEVTQKELYASRGGASQQYFQLAVTIFNLKCIVSFVGGNPIFYVVFEHLLIVFLSHHSRLLKRTNMGMQRFWSTTEIFGPILKHCMRTKRLPISLSMKRLGKPRIRSMDPSLSFGIMVVRLFMFLFNCGKVLMVKRVQNIFVKWFCWSDCDDPQGGSRQNQDRALVRSLVLSLQNYYPELLHKL